MSDVADGPEIMVVGAVGSTRAMASGISSTTESSGTMQMWWSGTSVMARRPSSGRPDRKMVPVCAQDTVEEVTTASTRLRSRTVSAEALRPSLGSTMARRAAVSSGSSAVSSPSGIT